MSQARRFSAPGRVNLIGDHTDYNQGVALPLAINLRTTVEFTPNGSSRLTFFSTHFPQPIDIPIDLPLDASVLATLEPPWARLVGAMAATARSSYGGVVRIESDIPAGRGLSSSAALLVALAGAFGVEGSAASIASLCQQAELFSGVPVGMMDPLVCAGGRASHALLIDFSDLTTEYVPLPEHGELVVLDSGIHRSLRHTPYSARVAECDAAAVAIGSLGAADLADLAGLRDPTLHRRARHVVTECSRVRQVVDALASDDLTTVGTLLVDSHRSLATDFQTSTPEVDNLVEYLCSMDGVYGARITGAGFGGCVIALGRPGAIDIDLFPEQGWRVVPSDGSVISSNGSG